MNNYQFGQRVKLKCDPSKCCNHADIYDWEGMVVATRKSDKAIIVRFDKERPRGGNAKICSDFEIMPGYEYKQDLICYFQALCDDVCIIESVGEEITGQVKVLRDI